MSIRKYFSRATDGKHLIIKRALPLHGALAPILISVSLGMAIYLGCLSQLDTLTGSSFSASADDRKLQALNARLTSQNNRLRDHVAILERAAQVDRIAHAEVHKTVQSLQDEIREAKEELLFHQELVASSDRKKGFTIQSFDLRPGEADQTYRYRMVLTRFWKDDKVASGKVRLSVVGQQKGKPARLALSDMMPEKPDPLVFRFRNFWKSEGYLTLPTGFIPHRVLITAYLKGKRTRKIAKTVDWSKALD